MAAFELSPSSIHPRPGNNHVARPSRRGPACTAALFTGRWSQSSRGECEAREYDESVWIPQVWHSPTSGSCIVQVTIQFQPQASSLVVDVNSHVPAFQNHALSVLAHASAQPGFQLHMWPGLALALLRVREKRVVKLILQLWKGRAAFRSKKHWSE